ncbi:MAG: hypothetical protein NC489_39925 [Ruminococcus flavefaciens]|nr:hypothetical protein [Ruminococcus flavefaciens]
MEYSYKPTTHGRAAMAAYMALGTKPFHITRVVFGSGMVDKETNLADMHELIAYVSDGAVAERRHEDDRFYITIQFANSQHKEVKTFILSEFIVYVEDPVTGEDTDLLYGTLGDYRQPVPGYNPAFPPSVFNFPLELILSDEIQVAVSAPAGLVTHAELLELLNGIGTDRLDITIPSSGWITDTEAGGPYALHADIANTKITEKMIPALSVAPASMGTAINCKLCPAARTLDGVLRVYAATMPEAPIAASLILLDTAYQTNGTVSGTAVKVREDITVKKTGWVADAETGGLRLDIAWPEATEKTIPSITVLPDSLEAATACGFSPLCQTITGAVRVYAKSAPAAEIKASVALLDVSPYANGGGTVTLSAGSEIPLATAQRAGAVKPGSTLKVAADGTLDVNTASAAEVTEMLDGVFPDSK